jgi:hypothetical protein
MELKPEESSALGLMAQFSKVPRARPDLETMLIRLGSDAQKVGKILLGESPDSFSENVRATARAYQAWHQANLRIGSRRVQRASTARRSRFGSLAAKRVRSKSVTPYSH